MKATAGVGMPRRLATVVTAADGVTRCRWATATGRDLTDYHDHEWEIATHDETALFEALVLTYFENGLSWTTVFDNRKNLRGWPNPDSWPKPGESRGGTGAIVALCSR